MHVVIEIKYDIFAYNTVLTLGDVLFVGGVTKQALQKWIEKGFPKSKRTLSHLKLALIGGVPTSPGGRREGGSCNGEVTQRARKEDQG